MIQWQTHRLLLHHPQCALTDCPSRSAAQVPIPANGLLDSCNGLLGSCSLRAAQGGAAIMAATIAAAVIAAVIAKQAILPFCCLAAHRG